ncbi:uncharacterized protein LOC124887124 [Capsicum annuum]|uniref:uncharacterized protein LOC124887124 n=1 Tax=Capsicum annuum TaxID=4072 RepID=UPI001FB196AC|nr:uncharacterized protein LOC124887124 [Capsicum annuum]
MVILLCSHISKKIVIERDFNRHIGVNPGGYDDVHGSFGFGDRNGEGAVLLDFARAFGLVVVNSRFSKKEDHLISFRSVIAKTQIDLMLLRKEDRVLCKDCKKSFRRSLPEVVGDGYLQSGDNFKAQGAQSQASGGQSTFSCPPCLFCGRLHRGYYDEGMYKCFKYSQPIHMLKNCPIGKGALGVDKAPVALSSAPAPSGMASVSDLASGTGTGQNRLYALASR